MTLGAPPLLPAACVLQSAIDFDMTMERQPDPKGDRVRIVLSGKNLAYKRY